MKFWEAIKAYQESGVLSRREDVNTKHKAGFTYPKRLLIFGDDVCKMEFELEPQKIEVTREMLAKAWGHHMPTYADVKFAAFAESLGFRE